MQIFFSIENSVGCVIKDFRFIIAQSVSSPTKCIMNVGSGSYLRLESCIFQRKELMALEIDINIQNYLIGSNNNGDVYMYNCDITNFVSRTNLISANSFYCYNSTFKNITVEKDSVISQYGQNVDIIDSVFDNLTNKDGNGGGLRAMVKNKGCEKEDKNADLCVVKGCIFIGCTALNGGGMSLTVDKNY